MTLSDQLESGNFTGFALLSRSRIRAHLLATRPCTCITSTKPHDGGHASFKVGVSEARAIERMGGAWPATLVACVPPLGKTALVKTNVVICASVAIA